MDSAAAAAAAAASRRQRGGGGSTNNQQSTKSIDCSGNRNGNDDSDDDDNGNKGDGGILLLPTPPPLPTPLYCHAAAATAPAAKLAAAAKLHLWQDGRRRQRGQRTAQSTTNHCLSVGFVGIDGGCEHYLPFHQPHFDNFMPDANHQQMWLIALPVAQPPPIRLVLPHPNTMAMGNAANVWFCQNHRWGRVIGGVLPMSLKSDIFTHINELGCS